MLLYDLTQLVFGGQSIIDVQHIVESIQLGTHVSTEIVRIPLSLRRDQRRHLSKQRLPAGADRPFTQPSEQNPRALTFDFEKSTVCRDQFPSK